MDDLISRQAAIDAMCDACWDWCDEGVCKRVSAIQKLPAAQPILHGYNVEHLELIARVLQKEDLPPERVVEALTDIGRIVDIVRDEFEETLRKAVDQCVI